MTASRRELMANNMEIMVSTSFMYTSIKHAS